MKRLLIPVLLLAGLGLAQENYSANWSGHRTLHINTSANGTVITANVMKYPTLVRLTAADSAVFAASKTGGADIRFTKTNNTTRLQYAIDQWDSAGRSAAFWVLLDTVYANSATQNFHMHWGNAAAADSQKNSAVFDSANGFVAVWHLGDSTGSKVRPNSVPGGNPATPGGSSANLLSGFVPRAGIIGMADTLRAQNGGGDNDDHFTLGSGYEFAQGSGTFSMWSKVITTGAWNNYLALSQGPVVGAGIGQAGLQNNIFMGRDNNTNNFYFRSSQGTVQSTNFIMSNALLPTGVWANFTVTFTDTGRTRTIYKDGALLGSFVTADPTTDTVNIIRPVTRVSTFIGRSNFSTGDRNYRGMMDEVRISKVARSADWVALDFGTQNAAQTTVTPPSAPTLSYAVDSVSVEAGFPIAQTLPASVGGVPNPTFSISPALTAGLTFNTTTGLISGTVAAATAKTKYTVTATNATGSITDSIWITITAPSVAEDYTTWTNTKTLTLSGAALGITGSVSRIPVLVRLGAGDAAIFAAGRASLRFSKSNSIKLKYAIDTWDSVGKSASVWVLYDDVGTGSNTLRIHWGKAGAVSQSSSPSVFEPANGFVGVYHMGNPIDTSAASTSPRPNEARPGFNLATPVNLTTIAPVKPGVIGMADSVPGLGTTAVTAGTASGFSLDTLFTGTFPTNNLTYSVWMQQALGGSRWASAISMGNVVACCGNVSDGVLMGSSGVAARALGYQVATRVGTDGNPTWPSTAANVVDTNTWMYVSLAVRAGTNGNNTLYLNGNALTVSAGGGDRELRDTTRAYVSLGRNVFNGDVPLRGMLDEARIANVARSNDWFKVDYATQKPGVAPVSALYPATVNYAIGAATITPTVSGGTGAKFSVSPTLPTGLSMDTLTGIITGTTTTSAPLTAYTVTAVNGPWTSTSALTFSVGNADGAYLTAWTGHRYISVNTTTAGVAGLTLRFPLLVTLGTADSAVFNGSQSNGRDIRFTKLNGTTRLQHEIESWDAVNKRAAIWVLLDSVVGGSTGSRLRMHFGGGASVGDSSKSSAVFDTANGFIGVYHLGNPAGAAQTAVRPNSALPGTNDATPASLASDYAVHTGLIGMADSLRGNGRGTGTIGDHFNLGTGFANFGNSTATMSMWFKPAGLGTTNFIQFMSIGNTVSNNGSNTFWMGKFGDATNTFSTEALNGTTSGNRNNSGVLTVGAWQYLAVTLNGANANEHINYVNGVAQTTQNSASALQNVSRSANYIGRSNWTGDSTARGVFDEVRVSKAVRSADWLKLEYANQNAAQNLVAITTAQVSIVVGVNQGSALTAGAPSLGFKALGQGLLFQVQSPASSKIRLAIVDMFGRTVWNNTVVTASGMNQIAWNGTSNNGQGISAGIYVVRMNLLDAKGKSLSSLNRKVPLTH